jgi:hypothetical protein
LIAAGRIHRLLASGAAPWYSRLVKVLIKKTDSGFTAQALEFDIATQAPSIDEVRYQIVSTFLGHLAAADKEGIGLDSIPPAPSECWKEWTNP